MADTKREAPVGKHEAGKHESRPDKQKEKNTEPSQKDQSQNPENTQIVDSKALYSRFVPYIENSHARNERSLKAGVWLLFLLPFILVLIQTLTGSNRIAFLIIWIFGMFAIATVLIFTAYSDHDLKKTLEELKEIVPPEEEIEIGNLLPVDAEGEGWLIDPQNLPLHPILAEKIPHVADEIREHHTHRKAAKTEKQEKRTEKTRETVPSAEEKHVQEHRPKHLAGSEAAPVRDSKHLTTETDRGTKKTALEQVQNAPSENQPVIRKMQMDDDFLAELNAGKKTQRKS